MFKMDNQQGPTVFHKESAQCYVMTQREKNMKKKIDTCICLVETPYT